jgi:hypothetical protein
MALATVIAPGLACAAAVPSSIYTNEEGVSFDKEAKRDPAPWFGITVAANDKVAFVYLFGQAIPAIAYKALGPFVVPHHIRVTLPDGRVTKLRMARTATCWGSAPKAAKKCGWQRGLVWRTRPQCPRSGRAGELWRRHERRSGSCAQDTPCHLAERPQPSEPRALCPPTRHAGKGCELFMGRPKRQNDRHQPALHAGKLHHRTTTEETPQ